MYYLKLLLLMFPERVEKHLGALRRPDPSVSSRGAERAMSVSMGRRLAETREQQVFQQLLMPLRATTEA